MEVYGDAPVDPIIVARACINIRESDYVWRDFRAILSLGDFRARDVVRCGSEE